MNELRNQVCSSEQSSNFQRETVMIDQRAGTLCHSSAGQDGAKKGPFSTAIKHIILVSYSLLLTASQFIVPTGLEDASTCSPWGHLRDDSTLSWEEKNKREETDA